MTLILSGVHNLLQHLYLLSQTPECFRPERCPHCGVGGLWSHGCYTREADRFGEGENGKYLNPIPIPRFRCPNCRLTCAVLPECIAPRRWYAWRTQQEQLLPLIQRAALNKIDIDEEYPKPSRRTVWRWWGWCRDRFEIFSFHLRSARPELGRQGDCRAFWRSCLAQWGLSKAMAYLSRQGVLVP
jgi:hypothetical protein